MDRQTKPASLKEGHQGCRDIDCPAGFSVSKTRTRRAGFARTYEAEHTNADDSRVLVHRPLERGRVHEPVRSFGLKRQTEKRVVQAGLAAADAAAAAAITRCGRRFSRVGRVCSHVFNSFRRRFMIMRGGGRREKGLMEVIRRKKKKKETI